MRCVQLFIQVFEKGVGKTFAKVFPTWFLQLLASLFYCNSTSDSHTNHGVVTCADQTHHFYVGGNGEVGGQAVLGRQ